MKTLKVITTVLCSAVLGLTSCEKTEIVEPASADSNPVFESNENTSKIALEDGSVVHFYNVDDGEVQGVFVLEETNCSGCSPLNTIAIEAKKELSELEIFWALSKPGTKIPSFFKANTADNNKNSFVHAQGWGRELQSVTPVLDAKAAQIACNNESFTSSIAYGFIGDPEFIRLDKKPESYGFFKNDCANLGVLGCEKGTKYRYSATYSGIKRWKGKICSRAVQNANNDHYTGYFCDQPALCYTYVGPELYFEYYANGTWKSMKDTFGGAPAGFEVPANSIRSYTYSWRTTNNTSFRIRVKNAMGKDQFDFMMDK